MSRFHSTRNAGRSCRGKVRHATFDAALTAVRRSGETFGDAGLIAYQCTHCDGFHVGHAPPAERRRLRFQRLLKLIDRANGREEGRRA